MVDPAQWSIDRLFGALRSVEQGARVESANAKLNRERVAGVENFWNHFIGPPPPGTLEQVAQLKKRQAKIDGFLTAATQKFAQLSRSAQQWMRDHGINPSQGLSGLGLAPLVLPIAIIAATLVALSLIQWLHDANSAQAHAVETQEKAAGWLAAGKITPQQYTRIVADAHSLADKAMPKNDPLNLEGLAHALVPLAMIAGLVIFGPAIVRMLEGATQRRRLQRGSA